jgi:uncharacterized protein YbjT (DUF2867 family)
MKSEPHGKTVWIAGATGLVGGHALRALLERKDVARVISLGRRKGLSAHPKLEEALVDLVALGKDAGPAPELPPCDEAVCALGTTMRKAGSQQAFQDVDYRAVLAFARLARQAGARRFALVSSIGADANSRVFYRRVKGRTENALRALGFPRLEILRPSFLVGSRQEPRPAEWLGIRVAQIVSPLMLGPMRRYKPIRARKVGLALAGAPDSASAPGTLVLDYPAIRRVAREAERSA